MTNSLKECTNDSVLTGGFFPLLHHYFTYNVLLIFQKHKQDITK